MGRWRARVDGKDRRMNQKKIKTRWGGDEDGDD